LQCDHGSQYGTGSIRPRGRGPVLEMVRRHYGDLSPTLILGNLFTFGRKHFDRHGLVIWSGF
jgi:hypothetical protein